MDSSRYNVYLVNLEDFKAIRIIAENVSALTAQTLENETRVTEDQMAMAHPVDSSRDLELRETLK